MTKNEAEKRLSERRKRCKRKRGPMSISFTISELRAVAVLSAAGRTQETISQAAGLSLSSFRRAFENNEELRDAWLIGKAIRREQRIDDLEKQSKKGNVRATELLLRYEHGDAGPQTARQGGGAVTVNINANTVPPAQDGRSYAALMKRIQKGNGTALIEHVSPEQPVILDPIEAVKLKQRQECGKC